MEDQHSSDEPSFDEESNGRVFFEHGYMVLEGPWNEVGIAVGPGPFLVKGEMKNMLVLERPGFSPLRSGWGDFVVGELDNVSEQIVIRDSDEQGHTWEVMRYPTDPGSYRITRSQEPLGQVGQVCITLVSESESETTE